MGAPSRLVGDASDKVILLRGCDPVMADGSKEFLPPFLGNAVIVTTTDDDAFFSALRQRKWDVIFFSPGPCRWSAAKQHIPGGNEATRGWTLEQYRQAVREQQGADANIVETASEPEIIPLLRRALQLPP